MEVGFEWERCSGMRKVWCGDSGSSCSEAAARLSLLLGEAHMLANLEKGEIYQKTWKCSELVS